MWDQWWQHLNFLLSCLLKESVIYWICFWLMGINVTYNHASSIPDMRQMVSPLRRSLNTCDVMQRSLLCSFDCEFSGSLNAFWSLFRFFWEKNNKLSPCIYPEYSILYRFYIAYNSNINHDIHGEVSWLLQCDHCLQLMLLSATVCRLSHSRFCRLCWSLKMEHITLTAVRLTQWCVHSHWQKPSWSL